MAQLLISLGYGIKRTAMTTRKLAVIEWVVWLAVLSTLAAMTLWL